MATVVEQVLDRMLSRPGLQNAMPRLDDILDTDRLARIRAAEVIAEM